MLKSLLDRTLMDNTVSAYLTSLALLVAGIVVVRIVESVVVRGMKKKAEQTKTTIDDLLIKLIEKKLLPILYFGVFYLSIQNLTLSAQVTKIVNIAGIALVTLLGIRLGVSLIYFAFERYWEAKEEDEAKRKSLRRLLPIIKVILWGIGITFLLDNLGFEISAVVAGLGIGGIAVALAAQAVLGDLFSYFAILMDRPFELGDFIIIDDYMGTIEHIGIKTTRIRSLGGEQLVFSNTDLTGSRIRNYKRMEQRRIVFRIGVIYQTPAEKLKEIPGIIRGIIEGIADTRFDRAHFFNFGDSSLDLETVYYVISGDYVKYMDIQQEINLKLAEEFERRGIEFAYPTRTLFIEKGESAS
jgi:small-conductance mechanosensitive channel